MDFIGLIAVMGVFGIPISAIWTSHRQKMLKMQLQMQNQGGANGNAEASIEALRQEVRALRDTTMQYDLSFDTALQRMEQRVEGIERQARITPPADTQTQNTLLSNR